MNCNVLLAGRTSQCPFKYLISRYRWFSSTNPQSISSNWQSVIGLEIHAQIISKTKLFSPSANDYDSGVNCAVSLFDCAMPGTLPRLSRRCVEAAVLTAFGLNCNINLVSKFDRKHYFYADLPAGYQITQQRQPIATKGCLDFYVMDTADKNMESYLKRVNIKQLQLEQDSGKTFSDTRRTLVNLNRAGVGLMEIVTEPEMCSALEASCFVKQLQSIVVALDTCGGQMDKGQLRVDANISVNKPGEPMGVRTEIKNLNSYKFVQRAIEFEIDRQIGVIENGGTVVNETLGFDYRTGRTQQMRDKEERQDYRHMPEPNLVPLRLRDSASKIDNSNPDLIDIDFLRRSLPPLPADNQKLLIEELGIPAFNALFILADSELSAYFFDCLPFVEKEAMQIFVHNFIFVLRPRMVKKKVPICSENARPDYFVQIVHLMQKGQISTIIGQNLIHNLAAGDNTEPIKTVEEKNWWMLTDENRIDAACLTAAKQFPKLFRSMKNGNANNTKILANKTLKFVDYRCEAHEIIDRLKMLPKDADSCQ